MIQDIFSYEDAYYKFEYKWKLIQHLNDVFPKLYKPYADVKMNEIVQKQNDSSVSMEEALNFINESKKPDFTFKKYHDELPLSPQFRNILNDMYDAFNFIEGSEIFLREMSLVYLITIFEELLENILQQYYQKYQNNLKSEKSMTHEEILAIGKLDEIVDKMIEKELDGILGLDIEKLNEILLKRFTLDFRNQTEWLGFTECFYRRHVIVHNNGMPDEKYGLKTGYSGQMRARLLTDSTYLSKSLTIFQKFAKLMSDHFIKKYPLEN